MESTSHSETGHAEHATPIVYVRVYFFLIVMMFLTIAASKVPLGPFNNVVAMTIALAKATAVVLWFMQVRYGTRLTWVWASLGFIWLSLLFGIMGDYFTRAVLEASGWTR